MAKRYKEDDDKISVLSVLGIIFIVLLLIVIIFHYFIFITFDDAESEFSTSVNVTCNKSGNNFVVMLNGSDGKPKSHVVSPDVYNKFINGQTRVNNTRSNVTVIVTLGRYLTKHCEVTFTRDSVFGLNSFNGNEINGIRQRVRVDYLKRTLDKNSLTHIEKKYDCYISNIIEY